MGLALQSTSVTSAAVWQFGSAALITFVNPATPEGSLHPVQDLASARLAFDIHLTQRVVLHLFLASSLAAWHAVAAQRRI